MLRSARAETFEMPSGNESSNELLVGALIPSTTTAQIAYRLERVVGRGGMGTAFLAQREGPRGAAPVVVKVMHEDPNLGEIAPDVVAQKEAVALARLNQTVPPSPFVVRFVDSGSLTLPSGYRTPWTAIEYVHGGVEGTTLEDRVTYAVHKTGYAFEPVRAAHAVRCLAEGLTTIHGVGVIHRDVTPGNVLCCGFGAREIFKLADFGVARASGLKATFEGLCAGTVGYSAPEAAGQSAGAATDVFALAAVVYYLLTGQTYFAAESPVEALHLIISPKRPKLAEHPTLSPELAQQPDACGAIDEVLARATQLDVRKRPENPERFATELLAHLGEPHSGPRSSRQLLAAVQNSRGRLTREHHFAVRNQPQADTRVLSAAWDADGHALALVEDGGRFWNGDSWLDASPVLAKVPGRHSFTRRHEAGGWLIGGDTLAVIDGRGMGASLDPPVAGTTFFLASGRLDDVLLAAGTDPHGRLAFWPVVARRYLRPIYLPYEGSVSVLQRLDDRHFVVGGQRSDGHGFAALVAPFEGEWHELSVPSVRAFVGGAAAPERGVGLLAGTDGVVVRVEGGTVSATTLSGSPELCAAATDVVGREWVASRGTLFTRDPGERDVFEIAWHDPSWTAPFVSILAEPGLVLAVTSDGGILEGRSGA
jgi:serine/threonine protein kinase